MDEAENQINDLEHKEAKNNQSEQQEGKESTTSSIPIFTSQGRQKEKRKSDKLEIYLKK